MKQVTLILILFGLITSQFVLYSNNDMDYTNMNLKQISQQEMKAMMEDAEACVNQTNWENLKYSVCNYQPLSSTYKQLKAQCCKYDFDIRGYTYYEDIGGVGLCSLAVPNTEYYSYLSYAETKVFNKLYGESGTVSVSFTCGNNSPITYTPEDFKLNTDEDKANSNYLTCLLESSYFPNYNTQDYKQACKAASAKLTPEKYNIKCTYFYEASYPNNGICLGIPGSFDLGEVEYILRQNQVYYDGVNNQYVAYSRDGKETTGNYILGTATPKQPKPDNAGSTDAGSHLKTTMFALFLVLILF